jgi:hypothetical protein
MLQLLLDDKVKCYFPYHRPELVKNFLLLADCIFRSGSVNLYKLRTCAGVSLQTCELDKKNVYKKFIRLFEMKCKDSFCIGIISMIINILQLENCMYLIMDRTNWKIGKTNINILYIGLVLPNGTFIPILFDPLDKRGNSSSAERASILYRFCQLWQSKVGQKAILLADREFVGVDWFETIQKSGFSMVIRLRYKDYFKEFCTQHGVSIEEMREKIAQSLQKEGYFRLPIQLGNLKLYYIVLPSKTAKRGSKKGKNKVKKSDETFILLSDEDNVIAVAQHYKKRWKIEVFFLHMKSNGFNMEDLNLKILEKIQLMSAILALIYANLIQEHIKNDPKIKVKTFKSGKASEISIFRNSYDDAKLKILNITHFYKMILNLSLIHI